MGRRALLLSEAGNQGENAKLARILEFFGVPWKTADTSGIVDVERELEDNVVFASATTLSSALNAWAKNGLIPRTTAFYMYASSDREATEGALQALCGNLTLRLNPAPAGMVDIRISDDWADATGPMTGLEFRSPMRREDAVLSGTIAAPDYIPLITAGGAPAFIRAEVGNVPLFFCASSYVIDIEERASRAFYDIKEHFCSAVPLIAFIRQMFRGIAWQPQETGGCLIVDDPLLKNRYGACDFRLLRELMRERGFTTNVAFIPWNWKRTSPTASELFRSEFGFSVSVHGCDHTKAEFGDTSSVTLSQKARLALRRMQEHESRTGIHHDRVMVFPQGVFSSICPEVLRQSGFLAAVNTETLPVDCEGADTRIADIWDIAIMRYGGFPIFTRRYPHHGLENFAFDLLLGKPCLIVSHHDYFKNDCADLLVFINKLQSLRCDVEWRSLAEVIRRACRRRPSGMSVEEIEMYGAELTIANPSDRPLRVQIRKREPARRGITVAIANRSLASEDEAAKHTMGAETIEAGGERRIQSIRSDNIYVPPMHRPLRHGAAVAARRMLSEFRDHYVSKKTQLWN